MVWCIASFLPVLLLEGVVATTYADVRCPTMETFRHCQVQQNKTIFGSRHVVHCSGRIAVRRGFVVAEEILRKSVNVSTLLTFLEDFESAVFIPNLLYALRHAQFELQLEPLVAITREAPAVSDAAAVGQLQHGVGTPIDVCTLFSTKHNVFVRVEVYTGLRWKASS